MRKAITICFAIMMLANFAASADQDRQRKFALLLIERSRLQERLAQQPSPEIAASLRERLEEINETIRNMGVSVPDAPEPHLNEVERTDLTVLHPLSPEIGGRRYRFDFSVTPSFANNYFWAVAGTPQQAAWLTNVSTSFQLALVRSRDKQLTAGVDIQRTLVRGIENADWDMFGARLIYANRIHQLAFQGFYTPQRLTFVASESELGFARASGFGADYTGRFTRNMSAGVFYRRTDVRYPGFDDRNLTANRIAGDARFRFHNLFMPGVGFEWTAAMAQSDNFAYREMAPALLLGARLGRVATLNLRYRYRLRNYPIDDAQADNFGRKDWRHDAYMYVSIGLGKHLDLIMFSSYIQNFSTRAYRGFTSLNSGATLKYKLPGQ